MEFLFHSRNGMFISIILPHKKLKNVRDIVIPDVFFLLVVS